MVYLLAGFSKITQAVVLPLGTVDLCFHSGRDTAAEHPDFGAFAHESVAEEQTKLSFLGVGVIQKLGKQQMRCGAMGI